MRMTTINLAPLGGQAGGTFSLSGGGTVFSNPVQTSYINRVSMQVALTGSGTPNAKLGLQASDDVPPPGTEWTPNSSWQPTNWSEITSADVTVSATGAILFPSLDIAYRFVRLAMAPQAGATANTFTATMHQIGWP